METVGIIDIFNSFVRNTWSMEVELGSYYGVWSLTLILMLIAITVGIWAYQDESITTEQLKNTNNKIDALRDDLIKEVKETREYRKEMKVSVNECYNQTETIIDILNNRT